MNSDERILYRINNQDEIVFVSENWDCFALNNDAPHLTSKDVTGKSLWSFVTDVTTEQLYREIIRKARTGQTMRFNFRCDSPELCRAMEMIITVSVEGDVQFETQTLGIEERPSQMILKSGLPRGKHMLSICGWCKKILTGENVWEEIEKAVSYLRLFEDKSRLPQLTHGICIACFQEMSAKLQEKRLSETTKE